MSQHSDRRLSAQEQDHLYRAIGHFVHNPDFSAAIKGAADEKEFHTALAKHGVEAMPEEARSYLYTHRHHIDVVRVAVIKQTAGDYNKLV